MEEERSYLISTLLCQSQFEGEPPRLLAELNANFVREVQAEVKGECSKACDELKQRVNRLFLAAVIRFLFTESSSFTEYTSLEKFHRSEQARMYPTANIVISGMDHQLQRYLGKLMNINEDGTLTASQPDRLNFQTSTDVNAAVFPLSQWSMREAAYYYEAAGPAGALFVAAGDALVSPHFLSGSGVSLARSVVESIAAILRKNYPAQPSSTVPAWRGHLAPSQSSRLVEDLHRVQSEVVRFSLYLGEQLVQPLSPSEQKKIGADV